MTGNGITGERRAVAMIPKRIQLRRTKGWRKPEGAITVSRSTKYGNPYRWNCFEATEAVALHGVITDDALRRWAADRFDRDLRAAMVDWDAATPEFRVIAESLHRLRGCDVACWCPLEAADGSRGPCHGDSLLVLANPGVLFPWANTVVV